RLLYCYVSRFPSLSSLCPYTSLFRSRHLVLFGEFVHAEDGDDVLQLLVLLQDPDDLLGHAVVLVAHDRRLEDPRRRGQRVHGRVDRKRTRLNSSHVSISYAVFCVKKK